MDQQPVQQTYESIPSGPHVPFLNRFFPLLIIILIVIILTAGGFLLFQGSKIMRRKNLATVYLTPTIAAVISTPAPTIPEMLTPTLVATTSAAQKQIGRLAFIRDGFIYHSDLTSFSLLVKPSTSAADKLSWSPKGSYISWRPKTKEGTPSSVFAYKISSKKIFPLLGNSLEEISDYAWSPDEKKVGMLTHSGQSYTISLLNVYDSIATNSSILLRQQTPVRKLTWRDDQHVVFLGNDGIGELTVGSPSAQMLVEQPDVLTMRISPDRKILLFSRGSSDKSDLFLLYFETKQTVHLERKPANIDMKDTNISSTILENGFIQDAIFFPSSNKLLVGYHYLQGLPLTGIYDISLSSFQAIAPFVYSSSDVMTDDLRILGPRIYMEKSVEPSWQVDLFTMEEHAKLSLNRVIPNASSPTFYSGE